MGFVLFSQVCFSQDSLYFEKLLQNGDFTTLKSKLSDRYEDWAYLLKGRIAQEEGDIDLAHHYWMKSFNEGDKDEFQTLLFYTLKSNYYYEKIEVEKSKVYLDSALSYLSNISDSKNLYYIRLLLGQSIKLQAHHLSINEISKRKAIYNDALEQYLLAEEEIIKHNLEKYYLAQTYHLIGNAHTDLVNLYSKSNNKSIILYHFNKAEDYYNKAEKIWKEEVGLFHHKLGTTYFVHGLLYYYIRPDCIKFSEYSAESYFRKSLNAFGVHSGMKDSFINYADVLMIFTHYNRLLLQRIKKQKGADINSINEHNKNISLAKDIWHKAQEHLKSKDKNLNLSIYGLNPYIDAIAFENWKISNHFKVDTSIINEANLNLKYRDIQNSWKRPLSNSIEDIKKSLKQDEMLLNYQSAGVDSYILSIYTNDSFLIHSIKVDNGEIKGFIDAIVNFNYDEFIKYSARLYKKLLPSDLKNRIIICPDGALTEVPFECLLKSKKKVDNRDYRVLDYFVFHNEIRYILTPSPSFSNQVNILPNLNLASPIVPDSLSELPFSKASLNAIAKSHKGILLDPKKVNLKYLFKDKPTIFHLSSHGIEKKNDFQILLTNEYLDLEKINQIKESPELLILNTCLSSEGRYFYGEGKNSFLRRFSMLGASGIISTRWKVDDKKSNELLLKFYEYFYKKNNSALSLNLAMKDRVKMAKTSLLGSPYYWASHKYIGQEITLKMSDSELTRTRLFLKIMIGLGVALLLLLIIKKLMPNLRKSL